jgi:hypothetical protein
LHFYEEQSFEEIAQQTSLSVRTDPKASYDNGRATITWRAINKDGIVKVWGSPSNNYKSGVDEYTLLKQVPVKSQKAVINLQKISSSFIKLLWKENGIL